MIMIINITIMIIIMRFLLDINNYYCCYCNYFITIVIIIISIEVDKYK